VRRSRLMWRRRSLTAVLLALVGAATFGVTDAFADAGNPITGTIKASATDNGNGTVTIYVRGQWNWLSHGNDCNLDRNGAGVGIIWNDTTEPGYMVTQGAISAGIGISSLRAGDTVNQVDRMVHPSDRGNRVEGYTVAGTDYPAAQQFVDPAPAGVVTAAMVAAWRSGCGRQPTTATASKGTNPERTGLTCGDGTVACSRHPWGSWGYEKNAGLGYSHTYLKTALPSKVCVNYYDVHGHNAGLEAPNGTKEITVDANGDNSIKTNHFDVTNGANCISVAVPTVSTEIHNAAHQVVTAVGAGSTVHDSVTVTGPATGNVTIDWFTNNTCSGTPTSTSGNVALDGNGHADATAFAKGPLAAGLYGFKAHFPGNGFFLAADGPCEPLRVVDANTAPAIAIVKEPKSQTVAPGGTAAFAITVTNTGNVVLTDVTVTDAKSPNCNRTKADIPALASMAPGAHVTYTCTRPNVTASFDNVAVATGKPPVGPPVTATDTAPVKIAPLKPATKKKVAKNTKKLPKPKVVSHKKPKATG
jgi:uncharacterized repeat protein (TIGR01451 family)